MHKWLKHTSPYGLILILSLVATALYVLMGASSVGGGPLSVSDSRKERGMATVSISNQAQLTAALTKAKGGETFVLASGKYSVGLSGRTFAQGITIQSADSSKPAVLTGISLKNTTGVTFKDLEVSGSALAAGEKASTYGAVIKLEGSKNVTFDKVNVHGTLDGNSSNDRYGIYARGSSGIQVLNSNFEQLYRAAIFDRTTDIKVAGSKFTNLRSDGLDFAQVSNVLIDSNYFTNFSPAGTDHPDAIQFWTNGTTQASSNITIKNNQILQGSASGMQGIFMRDEVGTLPYENVLIQNNLIYVTSYHNGIAIQGGKGVQVLDNTAVSPGGDNVQLQIRLQGVNGGVVKNNVGDILNTTGSTGLDVAKNIFFKDSPGSASLLGGLRKGSLASYSDLVVSGAGYQPVSNGLPISLAPVINAPDAKAQAVDPGEVAKSADSVLLDLNFSTAGAKDTSSFASALSGTYNAQSVVAGTGGEFYRINSDNEFSTDRKAKQLYGLAQFTVQLSLKRDSKASGEGYVMRLYNSWELSLASNELKFTVKDAAGKNYNITTKGASIDDLDKHDVSITFDGAKRLATIYVDGKSVGQGTIPEATKGAEYYGLTIGNPFGASFEGQVGNVKIISSVTPPAITALIEPAPKTVQAVAVQPIAASPQQVLSLAPATLADSIASKSVAAFTSTAIAPTAAAIMTPQVKTTSAADVTTALLGTIKQTWGATRYNLHA